MTWRSTSPPSPTTCARRRRPALTSTWCGGEAGAGGGRVAGEGGGEGAANGAAACLGAACGRERQRVAVLPACLPACLPVCLPACLQGAPVPGLGCLVCLWCLPLWRGLSTLTASACWPRPCRLQGCMKSGQVLTDKRWKWYEPEHWRFGDPAGTDGRINYPRHASGGAGGPGRGLRCPPLSASTPGASERCSQYQVPRCTAP